MMRSIGLSLLFVSFLMILVAAMKSKHPTSDTCKFYGNGHEIPVYAVRTLVKAEFNRLTLAEIDTLQRYFALTRHICPFEHCPMKEQVRFHGCGICRNTDTCYLLDRVHWRHPTWSYDDCEEYLLTPSKDSLVLLRK